MSPFIPTDDQYLSPQELMELGFSHVGDGCRISRKCSFYAISGEIGNNVRIDDFCIIKGYVVFKSYIHVGAYTLISGVGGGVFLHDCSTLSSGVHIYTASDVYSASSLSSTVVPVEYTTTKSAAVDIKAGALIGAQSLILPGAIIGSGASVGAHCIIYGNVKPGAVIVNREAIGKQVGYRDIKIIENMIYDVVDGKRE
jgi:acetyltransferase-like isoleucine patch superfamily enzyme